MNFPADFIRFLKAASRIAVLTGATPRDLLDALADHVLESVMQIEEVI